MTQPHMTNEMPFVSKDLPEDYEYLWAKVKRERKEGHPIYDGGNYRAWQPKRNVLWFGE